MILNIRDKYPNSSLANLYDKLTMPSYLRKAHQLNDIAVMGAYGLIGELNKLYQSLTEKNK